MRRAAQARLQMRPMRPAQQLEGAGPVLALVAGDAGGEQQQRAFLGRPPGGAGALGRGDQPGQGLQRFAGVAPVLGDVRRLGRPRLEIAGHLGMELARDRRRHRAARRLEDQVVGERAFAQHLRGVELAPGIAQVDRAQAQHVRGEVGAEVGAGDRGAARQLHRHRRQPLDALADQVGDVRCGRQPGRERADAPPCSSPPARASASASRAGTSGCRRCAGPAPARAGRPRAKRRRANRSARRPGRRRAAAAPAAGRHARRAGRRGTTAPPVPARAPGRRRSSAGRGRRRRAAASPRRWRRRRTAGRRRPGPATPSASALAQRRFERGDEAGAARLAPRRRAAELRQEMRELGRHLVRERSAQAREQQPQQA